MTGVGLPARQPRLPPGRRISLHAAVGYLSLFSLMAILTACAGFALLSRQQLFAQASAEAQRTAAILADHSGRLFETSDYALREVIRSIDDLDWPAIGESGPLREKLGRMVAHLPFIEEICLNDDAGGLRLAAGRSSAFSASAADRDYFRNQALSDHGLYVGAPVIDRAMQRTSLVMSRRIADGLSGFRGVVALSINAEYVSRFLASLELRLQPVVVLLREEDGSVLLQRPAESGVDAGRILAEFTVGRAGADEGVRQSGEGMIVSARKVGTVPLLVGVGLPRAAVSAAWRQQMLPPLVLATAALGALAALALFAFRQARLEARAKDELERQIAGRTAELSAAKQQLETLFHEVNHRIKNNLQVIGSLLRLQASRSQDEPLRAALRESIGRVQAMSLLHELLYSKEPRNAVAFDEFLRRLVDQIGTAYAMDTRVKVEIEAEPVDVDLVVATPLALLLNELLTNAFKHAFPDRGGTIGVSLRRDGEHLVLVVQDDGIGLPEGFDWRSARSFGLQIVGSLARQLDAEVEVGHDHGSRFHLRLPLRAE